MLRIPECADNSYRNFTYIIVHPAIHFQTEGLFGAERLAVAISVLDIDSHNVLLNFRDKGALDLVVQPKQVAGVGCGDSLLKTV